jgi:Flp pilus assembly protein TadB
MLNPGLFFFGMAFWVFMAVAAVAGIVSDYKKRQLELEPLRAAIERGQQLDPAIIERLMAREQREQEINPMHLQVGGIISIAASVGLAALAGLVSQVLPGALFPILGAGVLVMCVGVGLVVAARAIERHQRQARTELVAGPRA